MEQNANVNNDKYTIDLLHIARSLWQRAWIIVLTGILVGAGFFYHAAFIIAPTYTSYVLLYVNNSDISLGGTSLGISSADIAASKNLVNTYTVILKSRVTMERVIEKTGVAYSPNGLAGMITAASEDETEVMRVTVTSTDPYEACEIANCISEVLPTRISEIMDGSSMEVVSDAVVNVNKVAPNVTRYTAIGILVGVVAAVAVLAILAVLDDTIHSEDYILRSYNYPILAKIPNLTGGNSGRYGYYSSYYKRSYYQKRAPYGSENKKEG